MLLVIMLLFKHEKPGGWGYVNIRKPVSYDGYVHVLCFIQFLFTVIIHYTGKNQAGIAFYSFKSCSKTVSGHEQKCQI